MIFSMEEIKRARRYAAQAADTDAVCRRFKAARIATGLSSTEFSKQVKVLKTTVSMWENAVRYPTLGTVVVCLPRLGITLDWLYLGDDRGLTWEKREQILPILAQLEQEAEAAKHHPLSTERVTDS